jgi:outer membrane protein OmpA-like peptidoglycan-associated protein
LKLSDDRAKAVVDYLVKKKVNKDRLTWKGYGETKPLKPNSSEEHRALNRRVEFRVVER